MFTRILVPTDGTEAATAAVDAAIALAQERHAQIIGLHVVPMAPLLGRAASAHGTARDGEHCLAYVEHRAAQAHVPATVLTKRADAAHEAIIATARDLHCDLIVMASRARSPARALLLGSQTQTVLTHSAIPVLVIPRSGSADS